MMPAHSAQVSFSLPGLGVRGDEGLDMADGSTSPSAFTESNVSMCSGVSEDMLQQAAREAFVAAGGAIEL